MEMISQNKSFDGWHKQYEHDSAVLGCRMRFAIYLPPQVAQGRMVPVLYWLSGLTCNDENFMQKAGAQRIAAELGMAIVAMDTSPRGEGVADKDQYDLGKGAGFYVNATQEPWKPHYRMYDYVVKELPELVEANFPVSDQRAISGHSMGGHGAITIALRNPRRYRSVSAFSPITNPVNCPWGQQALTAYLGNDRSAWKQHDSCELMRSVGTSPEQRLPMRVDQGEADNFMVEQLKPEALEAAAEASDYPLSLYRHAGYDHSYYFIASFIEEHLRFHWQHMASS